MAWSGKAAVWGERLRRYERSGLTVAAFCQGERVSVPSFYHWRRRLAGTSAGRRPKNPARPAASPAFQPVLLSGSGVVSIELPSGIRMELPAQVQLVRAVVAELLHGENGRAGDF